MLKLWGVMDFLYLASFVITAIGVGRIPFISDLQGSQMLANNYGNVMPIAVASLSLLLMVSLVGSGYTLFFGKRFGKWLVYGQFPFRLILVMPSFFFIPWMLRPLQAPYGLIVVILLVTGTEVWKLLSVKRAYTQHNQSLQPTAESGG